MNKLLLRALIVTMLATLVSSGMATAQDGPTVDWSLLAAGGGSSSGGSIRLNDTLGQAVIGAAAGGGITVDAGYGQQVLAPETIADLRASITTDNHLRLEWTAIAHDTNGNEITGVTYNVYRDRDYPYFSPTTAYASDLTSPIYTDPDATVIGQTGCDTYYLIRAVYQGVLAAPSYRVGTFSFALVLGQ